jgi:hypothetical protein
LFSYLSIRAAIALHRRDGAIATASPHSDVEELNLLLYRAQRARIISSERERAWLYVYSRSRGKPEPLLGVDPGEGPILFGPPLKLRQGGGEDPISFTMRILEELTEQANGLLVRRLADSARLDYIADYMDAYVGANPPWRGTDLCELLATQLRESGRTLRGAGD